MPWFGKGRSQRDAVAAIEVLEEYEGRVDSGELHVRVEKGIKLPGANPSPTLYRAALWDEASGEIGQLMFSWYDKNEPDADFVSQQLGTQFLGMAVSLRDGMKLGGSIRFTHYPHQ